MKIEDKGEIAGWGWGRGWVGVRGKLSRGGVRVEIEDYLPRQHYGVGVRVGVEDYLPRQGGVRVRVGVDDYSPRRESCPRLKRLRSRRS